MRPVGVGVVSLGWMGGLHARSYLAVPPRYPELGIRPYLAHACDTAPERVAFARDVLGLDLAESVRARAVVADDAHPVGVGLAAEHRELPPTRSSGRHSRPPRRE